MSRLTMSAEGRTKKQAQRAALYCTVLLSAFWRLATGFRLQPWISSLRHAGQVN